MEQFIFYDLYRDVSMQLSNRPKRAEGNAEKEQPDEKVALNNIFSCRQAAFFGLTRSRSFLSP